MTRRLRFEMYFAQHLNFLQKSLSVSMALESGASAKLTLCLPRSGILCLRRSNTEFSESL